VGIDTSYGLFALQAGSPDGGIFFGGLVLLPVGFVGLVSATVLGSLAVKSRVESFDSIWAVGVAIVSALVLSALVRILLAVPPIEVELVTVSSALLFPLGIAVGRRDWLSSGLITAVLVVALYSMTRVFPNTFNEVLAMTLGAGLVFFLIGRAFGR
jgi:hypothetical protein